MTSTAVQGETPDRHPESDGSPERVRCVVVMGVSGTGKSTLGAALSKALHLPFIDGDDLHPAANVAKMSRGEALDDDDRQPWLDTIRRTAVARVLEQLEQPGRAEQPLITSARESGVVRGRRPSPMGDADEERPTGVVVACSSLKKAHRAALRGEGGVLPTYFVYLKGDRDVLAARMQNREGHFMKVGMLEGQLDALESPEGEPGVVTVSVEMSTGEQVRRVVEAFFPLGRRWSSLS